MRNGIEIVIPCIACLVSGQGIKISECKKTNEKKIDAKTALKLKFGSRYFPVVPLHCFNGEASH